MNARNISLEHELLDAPAVDAEGGRLFDVEKIIGVLRRNIWIAAGVIGLALVAGVVITLLMTPQYTATASVQINQEADRILETEELQPTASYQDADRFLQTQLDVLESRHMANRVATAENLFEDPAFLELAEIEIPQDLNAKKKSLLLQDRVIAYLQNNSSTELPVDSRVVKLHFTSPDAQLSARLANSYVDEFIQDALDRRLKSSDYARQYLANELAESKVRLEESERELNDYARSSGVIRIKGDASEGSGDTTVTSRNLVQLNDAAAEAEAAVAVAEARWRNAAGTSLRELPEVVSNSAYQALQAERARVLAQLNDQLQNRRDDHPEVKALRAQLSSMDQQLDAIARSVRGSIRNEYRAAQAREAKLKATVNGLTGELIDEEGRSVQYNILAREVDTNRTIYDGLLQRFKEIGAQAGIASNNLSSVDPAVEPLNPSEPRPLLNMLLALIIGIVLAILAAFIREIVDDKLRTPRDIEDRLGKPVFGLIPVADEGSNITEDLEDPKSTASEAIHSLRTNVLVALEGQGDNILMLTSSEASEGKSTTAMALARDISRLGRNVLLVDADLRRPQAHNLLGMSRDQHGLSDALTSPEILSQAIRKADFGFDFLSTGADVSDPTMIFNSARFGQLLQQLASSYDMVIIDAPPVLGLADAPSLARHIKNVLFIVEAGRGRLRRVQHATTRLRSVGANILGIVLTKVDFESQGYAYGYGYGYEYHRYAKDGQA